MPTFKSGLERERDLLSDLKVKNNIEFLGGERSQPVRDAYDRSRLQVLSERAVHDRVSDFPGLGSAMWNKAFEDAKTFFSELVGQNKHLIPEAVRDVVVLEPKLRVDNSSLAAASDIAIWFSSRPLERELKSIADEVEQRTKRQLNALRGDGAARDAEEANIHLKAAEDLYTLRQLCLSSTVIHEMMHLLQKKVFGIEDPHSNRRGNGVENNPARTEDPAPVTMQNGQRFRQYINGNAVYVPDQKQYIGTMLTELTTVAAETLWWKQSGFNVVPKWSRKINVQESLTPEHVPLVDKVESVCRDSGIMDFDAKRVDVQTLGLDGMSGVSVYLPYRAAFRAMIDLGREIFRDEALAHGDPYKAIFERALASSCAGKPSRFFTGATFEGLDALPIEERNSEFRKYQKFLMGFSHSPSDRDTLLLRAFIGAGVHKQGGETIALRGRIMDLKKEMG